MGMFSRIKNAVSNAITAPVKAISSGNITPSLSLKSFAANAATGGLTSVAQFAQKSGIAPESGFGAKVNNALADPSKQISTSSANLRRSLTPAQSKLLQTIQSASTGGISDAVYAVKGGGGTGQIVDRWVDPGGSIDYSIRAGGEQLPDSVRGYAPAIGGTVGSIWGPFGAAAGAGVGSKLAGQSYDQGWKNSGVAMASSYLGGKLNAAATPATSTMSGAIGTTGANAVTGAGTGAVMGAGTAAVTGGDIKKGAIGGAIGGGIAGAASSGTKSLSEELIARGIDPVVANTMARAGTGAVAGGLTSAARGGDVSQGVTMGGIGGGIQGGLSSGANQLSGYYGYNENQAKALSTIFGTAGQLGTQYIGNSLYAPKQTTSYNQPQPSQVGISAQQATLQKLRGY